MNPQINQHNPDETAAVLAFATHLSQQVMKQKNKMNPYQGYDTENPDILAKKQRRSWENADRNSLDVNYTQNEDNAAEKTLFVQPLRNRKQKLELS